LQTADKKPIFAHAQVVYLPRLKPKNEKAFIPFGLPLPYPDR
jgi:hypothetical protein